MNPNLRIVLDIAIQIKEENLRGKDKIPTSENFVKKMVTAYNKTAEEIQTFLEQLKESHYIFIFNVVEPDASLFVQGVEAYVYADQSILNELKHFTEGKLSKTYESTYYKRKSGFQVMRELSPKVREFNNTQLGRALEEAIHVDECLKIISSQGFEYTDSWRKEKLYKMYREEPGLDSEYGGDEYGEDYTQRPERRPKDDSKWGRAVNQFSVRFLVRIHFRKYDFESLRKLILTNKIDEMEDLLFVRDQIKALEKLEDRDPILKYHREAMTELRRVAQAKINIMRKSTVPEEDQDLGD